MKKKICLLLLFCCSLVHAFSQEINTKDSDPYYLLTIKVERVNQRRNEDHKEFTLTIAVDKRLFDATVPGQVLTKELFNPDNRIVFFAEPSQIKVTVINKQVVLFRYLVPPRLRESLN